MHDSSGRVCWAVLSICVGMTCTLQLLAADKPATRPAAATQPAAPFVRPLNRPRPALPGQPQQPASGERAFKVIGFSLNTPQVLGLVRPSGQLILRNSGPDIPAGGKDDLVSADYQFFDEHHGLVYRGEVSRGNTGARHDEVIVLKWALPHSLPDPRLAPHFPAPHSPTPHPMTPRPAAPAGPPPAPVEVKPYTVVVTLSDHRSGQTYDRFEQTVYARLPADLLMQPEPATPPSASAAAPPPPGISAAAPPPAGSDALQQQLAALQAQNEILHLKLENASLRAENEALRRQLQDAPRQPATRPTVLSAQGSPPASIFTDADARPEEPTSPSAPPTQHAAAK